MPTVSGVAEVVAGRRNPVPADGRGRMRGCPVLLAPVGGGPVWWVA